MFNESFQNSYNGSDCDVRFESSCGLFNHLHEAVKRAFLKLGPDVLFPSSLSPKKPLQVPRLDEMVWYNDALNNQQRISVIKALEGECRPLPYVIFGPPGTGKTVTVIEVQYFESNNASIRPIKIHFRTTKYVCLSVMLHERRTCIRARISLCS